MKQSTPVTLQAIRKRPKSGGIVNTQVIAGQSRDFELFQWLKTYFVPALPYIYSFLVILILAGSVIRAYGYTVTSRLKVHTVSNSYLRTLIATYELKDQAQKLKEADRQFTKKELADVLYAAQFAADEMKSLTFSGEKNIYSSADVQGLYSQYNKLLQEVIDDLDEVTRSQRNGEIRRQSSVVRLIIGVHQTDALKRAGGAKGTKN